MIQHSSSKKKSKLTVILFFVLTLVTSGSTYASITGNFDPNSVFATSSNSDDKKGGDSSDSDNGGSSGNNKKSKSSSEGDDGGKGGSSDSSNGGGSSDSSITSASPPAPEENTSPPPTGATSPPPAAENQRTTCPDGTTVDPTTSTCPTPPTAEETTPPPAASEQTCPGGTTVDPITGACPTTTTEQNTAPTDQTCPDGSTQDPMTGVCPPTSEGAGASPTNTPQGQPTTNMLTGGIQTAAPTNSPPSPPETPEPGEQCPGHVARNANGVCPSPLSKDSTCDEHFHHDASGKCVENTIPLADGTCAGGYSLENVDGKNTCNGKDVLPCPGNVARDEDGICFDQRPNAPCAKDFHRETSILDLINGGKCVSNTRPFAFSSVCANGYHIISADACAPNSMTLPDGTCAGGYHAVSKILSKDGKTATNCYPNEFPISAGTCAKGWGFVAATNSCVPGVDDTRSTQKSTPPSQTGGGSTEMGTPTTQTGGTTGTNTNPTTPTPPPTTTTTTNVINRGGSSGGGGSTSTTTAAPPAAQTFLTYVNAINKISIKYPSTWTKTELVGNPRIPVMFNAPTTVATTTAGTKTNFVISITPGATNLDSFTLQQINGLIQSKAVKYTITDTNAKILTPPTGITAFREVSYDAMKNDNVPLKGAAILFVNGGTGYSLLYLAKQTDYTQNLPMVQQMVNSFQAGGGAASGSGAPVQNVAAASR